MSVFYHPLFIVFSNHNRRNPHMTPNPPLRAPVPGTDEQGRRVYRVPLAKARVSATIYAEDYEALIAQGISGSWSWHTDARAVVVGTREGDTRRTHRVARLIMNPPDDHRVYVKNRNALDLRRDNLVVRKIKPKPTFAGQHRPV
ncbi:hypothetical protein [Bosea thiooxidans]